MNWNSWAICEPQLTSAIERLNRCAKDVCAHKFVFVWALKLLGGEKTRNPDRKSGQEVKCRQFSHQRKTVLAQLGKMRFTRYWNGFKCLVFSVSNCSCPETITRTFIAKQTFSAERDEIRWKWAILSASPHGITDHTFRKCLNHSSSEVMKKKTKHNIILGSNEKEKPNNSNKTAWD